MSNMYWSKKEENSKKAVEHTKYMEMTFCNEINESVLNTKVYDDSTKCLVKDNRDNKNTNIIIDDTDSVSAVLKYCNGKTAVLNFASYKNPGGMFMGGSSAQEESLCHESFLYSVLKEFNSSFYEFNRQRLNRGMYTNRALYTPDVVFIRDDKSKHCDVITCAAPNYNIVLRYKGYTEADNLKWLKSRIKFVLDIAEDNKVDTLILGAFGCGVFKQKAENVAMIFKQMVSSGSYKFSNVVFAVPVGINGDNYKAFERVFKHCTKDRT